MRDGAVVLDELIAVGEDIRQAEAKVRFLKHDRDARIFEVNETFSVPISTIATALGLRRETVVNAKLRAQADYLTRRYEPAAD